MTYTWEIPGIEIPQSKEAEEATLGAIIHDAISDPNHGLLNAVAEIIKPNDFYYIGCKMTYEAIQRIVARDEGLDNITLVNELKAVGKLDELGGPAYVTQLMNRPPTSLYAEDYAQIIKRCSVRRQLLNACSTIAKLAHDESSDFDKVIQQSEEALLAVTTAQSNGRVVRIEDAIAAKYKHLQDIAEHGAYTIPTGFSDLDTILGGGFRRKDLVIVCGRPGMGKTAWVLNMAQRSKKRTLIISYEMGEISMAERYMAMTQAIDLRTVRSGDLTGAEWVRATDALNIEDDVWITEQCGSTIADVINIAGRFKALYDIECVVVDHLHLMREPSAKNETNAISHITRTAKRLAVNLDIPLILLSQMNRDVENRQDKHPRLADLRSSGSIEQDADIVMGLYRDEYYNEDTTLRPNQVDVDVLKHRNGPTGRSTLYFHSAFTRFSDLVREGAVDYSGDHWDKVYKTTFANQTQLDD